MRPTPLAAPGGTRRFAAYHCVCSSLWRSEGGSRGPLARARCRLVSASRFGLRPKLAAATAAASERGDNGGVECDGIGAVSAAGSELLSFGAASGAVCDGSAGGSAATAAARAATAALAAAAAPACSASAAVRCGDCAWPAGETAAGGGATQAIVAGEVEADVEGLGVEGAPSLRGGVTPSALGASAGHHTGVVQFSLRYDCCDCLTYPPRG